MLVSFVGAKKFAEMECAEDRPSRYNSTHKL